MDFDRIAALGIFITSKVSFHLHLLAMNQFQKIARITSMSIWAKHCSSMTAQAVGTKRFFVACFNAVVPLCRRRLSLLLLVFDAAIIDESGLVLLYIILPLLPIQSH